MTNKIDNFNDKARTLFEPILAIYGYTLEQVKIFELNGKKWSTKHNYTNSTNNLRLTLEQAPYYTDYGFSLILTRIDTEESNALYNFPHEKQDPEDRFLDACVEEIFSNREIIDMIAGISWKKPGYFLVQK